MGRKESNQTKFTFVLIKKQNNHMDLDTRISVFGGFRTSKAQTSLHIRNVSKLAANELSISFLHEVSEAEQACLGMTISETPKTGFHDLVEAHTFM